MASTYWKEAIFNKAASSVSWSNVNALFLALAATGILVVHNSNDGLMWIVGRQTPTIIQQPNVYVTLIEATIGDPNYIKDDT